MGDRKEDGKTVKTVKYHRALMLTRLTVHQSLSHAFDEVYYRFLTLILRIGLELDYQLN